MNPTTDPGPRAEFGMCYLDQHDRIILFKLDTLPNNSTWSYDYNTNTWTNLQPSVTPALAQFNQLARIAYDSESDRVIFVDNTTGKVWAFDYDNNLWTDMNPIGPKPASDWRQVTAVAYDSKHDRVIIATPYYQETWAYDYNSNTWQQRGLAANVTLTGGGLYDLDYDPLSDIMILYGDNQITIGYDYTSDTWTDLSPNSAFPQAHHHAICYVHLQCDMLFYGGIVGDNNNTWTYVYNPCMAGIKSEANERILAEITPNPSSGIFSIAIPEGIINKIEIYNLLGELIYCVEYSQSQALVTIELPIVPKGIYLVEIFSGKQVFAERILLE